MDDLIYREEFRSRINKILDECKKENCAISLAICDPKGVDCFVAMDANAEDVAYMAAEQTFDFCRQVSEEKGIPLNQLAKLVFQDFTDYFNIMLKEQDRQRILLNNPVGEG